MKKKIYKDLIEKKNTGRKSLAVLLDPDKFETPTAETLMNFAADGLIDYFLVGGSLVSNYRFSHMIRLLKENCSIPVVLFPGNYMHIAPEADGILFLSLISGRNPDLLVGQHVIAAPVLKQLGIEVLSTGYILVDGGKPTTVSYMSNTQPIPNDKVDVASCTAMAGEMLGMKLIYLDAGSGALTPVPKDMIRTVAKAIDVPLIVGGGLNSLSKIDDALSAGADMVVIGNGIEKNPNLMVEVSEYFMRYNNSLNID
jgi:phosphoglycerol geranylgeranyltransferase